MRMMERTPRWSGDPFVSLEFSEKVEVLKVCCIRGYKITTKTAVLSQRLSINHFYYNTLNSEADRKHTREPRLN